MTKEGVIKLIKEMRQNASDSLAAVQAEIMKQNKVTRRNAKMVDVYVDQASILSVLLDEIEKREIEENENI